MAKTAIVKAASEAVVKAYVIGEGTSAEVLPTNIAPNYEEDGRIFDNLGAIKPPYDPLALVRRFEESCSLRPNVEAMATNVDGFGFRLEPVIDLQAVDADTKIKDALVLEKMETAGEVPLVSPEEVTAQRQYLEMLMRYEKMRLELFFRYVCPEMSFTELRERTRQDLEVTGNGYWEIVRSTNGGIAQFNHVPATSVRLMRVDPVPTDVLVPQKISAFCYRNAKVKRRFRKYVQVIFGQFVAFFKELDDTRIMSSKTGRIYKTEQLMHAKEPGVRQATEMIHFKIHSLTSSYGVPRWIGATLAVRGTRLSEEVNAAYFTNKAVPPLAVLVSGGALAEGAAERITNYIRDNIIGSNNFHNILVLEAEPTNAATAAGGGTSRCRIEIKDLMGAQQKDGLFQEYEKNNATKVGAAFRLPKLLTGGTEALNRATAEAALQYAEQQVFQPERQKFDHIMNTRILARMGICFHEFCSNSPVERDPEQMTMMVGRFVDSGILTPEEGRALATEVFNRPFDRLKAPWTRIPQKLLIAGIQPPPTPEEVDARKEVGIEPSHSNVQIAPTDAVTLMTVNEARHAMGLPNMKDKDGEDAEEGFLSVSEFQGRAKGAAVTGGNKPPSAAGQGDSPPGQKPPGGPPGQKQADVGDLLSNALRISALREALEEAEGKAATKLHEARQKEAEHVEYVPKEVFDTWFAPEVDAGGE